MTSKTIALSGAETRVDYSGGTNAWLRNDGVGTIYASTMPGVTAGADGVVSIPAGQAAAVYDAYGTVYLLGTGSVQLVGSDYTACPFKVSAQSGGSGADSVARAAIEAHEADTDIHVTAEDKSGWNSLSSPNLLINPDFVINQRGESVYSAAGYTVDGWKISGDLTVTVGDSVTLTPAGTAEFYQPLEVPYSSLAGRNIAVSASIDGNAVSCVGTVPEAEPIATSRIAYTSIGDTGWQLGLSWSAVKNYFYVRLVAADGAVPITLEWIKLELGKAATPFTPPDQAAELAKCQRYYQIRTTNDIDPFDLRPSMRTITDIKAVEGGYAYVAEL